MSTAGVRVAVVAESSRDPDGGAIDAVLRYIAGNTGNLAFQCVLSGLVGDDVEMTSWRQVPEEVGERYELLIVPEASVLTATKDFGWKADFIEKVDLPVVVLGVGRQAELGVDRIDVPSGTQRYVRAIAKRSHTIGVRGERTAAELARIGVHNTEVLGCPSLFWSSDTPPDVVPDHPRIVASPGPDRRTLRAAHRTIGRWTVASSGEAVAQSGRLLRAALDGEASAPLVRRSWRTRPGPAVPINAFLDVPAWLEFLRGFDVSIGARIHGALLAVAAGIPAVCVVHDDRTRELAETCALPTSTPSAVRRASTVQSFLDGVTFDWHEHRRTKHRLATRLIEVLGENGLTASQHLRSVAGSDGHGADPRRD
jgi:Polysaccharide pyruvyl transferase